MDSTGKLDKGRLAGDLSPLPRLVLFLAILLTSATSLAAYSVPPDLAMTRLEPHVGYVCDPNGTMTFQQARAAALQPLPDKGISFGYRQHTRCWFAFDLKNDTSEDQRLLLDLDYGLLDRVVLYQSSGTGWVRKVTGDAVPFHQRALPVRKQVLPLALKAGQQSQVFVSIETINSFFAPLRLWQSDAFYQTFLARDWSIGVFYGIGFGMLIYNLFLWITFREKTFLWYVVYVAAAMMTLAGWHGLYHRLWPDSVIFNNLLMQNMMYLAGFATMQFARSFLDTREWPRIDAAMCLYLWLVVAAVLSQFLLPAHLLAIPQGVSSLTCAVMAISVGVMRCFRGRRTAYIYVLGWSGFLIIATLLSLGAYGLFGAIPEAIQLLQVAIVFQLVMFSIGLSMRIMELRREKEEREIIAARAQAESHAKTEFLAKMSHEIRTPMNAVLGISELMADRTLPRVDQQRYVDTLHTASQTLMHVINDILDFSKMAAGKLELDDTDFDVHALVQECVSIMAVSAHEKSLDLQAHIGDDVPQWLRGDEIRIRQILLNLLGNAVKFTECGRIVVEVACSNGHRANARRISLSVKDSGMGMSQEQLRKLFQPFEQLDSAATRRFGGTGLGLAISRQLAELMGGGIEVSSRPGEGSRFTVTLPLRQGQPVKEHARITHVPLGLLSVLVVEDNPVNQMVVRAQLQRLGVTPELAHDGEEGLAYIKQHHGELDLVFMDCEMPNMDGYQATAALREWEKTHGLPPVKVVAMTAHAFSEHRTKCFDAGMDGYLSKPLLSAAVIPVLEAAALARQGQRVTGLSAGR